MSRSKSAFTGIKSAIGALVFLSQLTQKDREAGAYNVASMGDKAKILTNNVAGRIIGINPFSDVQSFPQTINLDGAFNKFTAIGVASGCRSPSSGEYLFARNRSTPSRYC